MRVRYKRHLGAQPEFTFGLGTVIWGALDDEQIEVASDNGKTYVLHRPEDSWRETDVPPPGGRREGEHHVDPGVLRPEPDPV